MSWLKHLRRILAGPQLDARDDRPSIQQLIESVNADAARATNSARLFFVICGFLFLVVVSTTHEGLLREQIFYVPLFSIAVPVTIFYIIAPLFLLVLYAIFLAEHFSLTEKLAYLKFKIQDEEAVRLAASTPIVQLYISGKSFKRTILGLATRSSLYFFPIVIFSFMTRNFTPYHNSFITWYQVVCTIIGVGILLLFMPSKILSFSWSRYIFFIIFAIFFVGIVAYVSTEKRDPCEPGLSFWPHNLSLRGKTLVLREPPPELLAAELLLGNSSEDAGPKHTEGLDLTGRDLGCADFTDAKLVNADFTGANLEGAVFQGADLRGALFLPAQLPDDVSQGQLLDGPKKERLTLIRDLETSVRPTNLNRVDLRGAKLAGAKFILAKMQNANLRSNNSLGGVDFSGTDLSYADLWDTHLEAAVLQGTILHHANLEGAVLTAATLEAAFAEGASFGGAKLECADLSHAHLDGAFFFGANLDAADLRAATTFGADLRSASLRGATGLRLEAVQLRGARVAGLTPSRHIPSHADLRDLDFSASESDLFQDLRQEIAELGEGMLAEACLERLEQAEVRLLIEEPWTDTLREASSPRNYILYDRERPPFQDWPPPDLPEDRYYEALADLLLPRACKDPVFREALAKKAAGDYAPSNEPFEKILAAKLVEFQRDRCAPLADVDPRLWARVAERANPSRPLPP